MNQSSTNEQKELTENQRAVPTPITSISVGSASPGCIKATGLNIRFLSDLVSKHLYDAGAMTAHEIALRLCLNGPIIDEILQHLRQEARIEVKPNNNINAALRFGLTDRGRACTNDALAKSGYIGPCPVPLDQYRAVMKTQSIHRCTVTQVRLEKTFENFVIDKNVQDQLGMAVNSGRAIFIYGPAGSGKTYTISQLPRVFEEVCLIPFAIAIDDTVVELFDPLIHTPVKSETPQTDNQEQPAIIDPKLLMNHKQDARWLTCKRPVVVCGGELTMDMLEIRFNPATLQYQAPLQMKANGGIFIIDDMGRQKPSPAEIFNRWIVPMEEHRDFLSLGSGRHFEVPFDEILVFSSNINPLELADEAFLRRIGYKIRFDYMPSEQYQAIWTALCEEHNVEFDRDTFNHLLTNLHELQKVPLLPCHPRDLLGIAMDHASYFGSSDVMNIERIEWAWNTYFVDKNQYKLEQIQDMRQPGGTSND